MAARRTCAAMARAVLPVSSSARRGRMAGRPSKPARALSRRHIRRRAGDGQSDRPQDLRLDQKDRCAPAATFIVHSLNTGVPHAVLFRARRGQGHGSATGRGDSLSPTFRAQGTNVNFVQVLGPNFIRVRTYERGVEGETLACGTGVTASALISAQVHPFRFAGESAGAGRRCAGSQLPGNSRRVFRREVNRPGAVRLRRPIEL